MHIPYVKFSMEDISLLKENSLKYLNSLIYSASFCPKPVWFFFLWKTKKDILKNVFFFSSSFFFGTNDIKWGSI